VVIPEGELMIYDGTGNSLKNLDKTVRKTTKALRDHDDEFDSIAVSGMSGVIVGVPVALRLKKPLIVVRKESDNSHHGGGEIINRQGIGERVLFLDDFVSSGETQDYVTDKIENEGGTIIAQFYYDNHACKVEGIRSGWRT